MKKLIKAAKIYLGVIGIVAIIAFTWAFASKEKSPNTSNEVTWEMPSFNIQDDSNIDRILKNGLRYKIKVPQAKILAQDKSTTLGDLKQNDEVFFDNAQKRFYSHPYIFVTAKNGKWMGWVHVKDLGYQRQN